MDRTHIQIYHSWLRNQIGVTDIQQADFEEAQVYFEHRIDWELRNPSHLVQIAHNLYMSAKQHPTPAGSPVSACTAWRVYINTVASQVAHSMDQTQINAYRLLTGKSYRRDITNAYLQSRQHEKHRLPAYLTYSPYSGITSDISSDWTRGYNGIIPIGTFDSYPTPRERNAALYNHDTGEKWPESEIWPTEEPEVLYHFLRMNQYDPNYTQWTSQCSSAGCTNTPTKCQHALSLRRAIVLEWETFLEWKRTHMP